MLDNFDKKYEKFKVTNFKLSLDQGGGNSGLKNNLNFNPELFTNFMMYKCNEGWNYLYDSMGFKVDFVCCIHLHLSALKTHPVIPKSLNRIQETFPNIKIDDEIVRLVPKTSPKFKRQCQYNVIQHGTYASQMNVSDWIIGLGGIENKILQQFETPLICLMLLKFYR